jgi:hypothetical protein
MGKLAALFMLAPFWVMGQQASCDILLLRKGTKVLEKYFAERPITFYTTDGMPVSGKINCIKNDSIYLVNYQVRRVQTAEGGIRMDTTGKYRLNFSIANIGSFPAGRQPGKNIVTDGTLLVLAGAGYLVLNIINTTREGDPPFGSENLPNVLAASGAVITGFLLKKAWRKRWVIGKKFNLKLLKS